MTRIVRSDAAAADIEDIWEHSAKHFGVATAEAVIRRIEATFLHLATFPGIGRERHDLAPGLRLYPVHGYPFVVLYAASRNDLEIARVFHVRRNLRGAFGH